MIDYIDIMLDIETAGVRVTAPLLSIGAVAFDFQHRQILAPFFAAVFPVSAYVTGIPEQSTIDWWADQHQKNPEAYANVWKNPDAVSIEQALRQFHGHLLNLEKATGMQVRIWGNAARFDLGILAYQYHAALGMDDPPWNFRNEMCYRSLKNSYKSWTFDNIEADLREQIIAGPKHTCVPDASTQAVHAISIAHAFSIDSLINGDSNNVGR